MKSRGGEPKKIGDLVSKSISVSQPAQQTSADVTKQRNIAYLKKLNSMDNQQVRPKYRSAYDIDFSFLQPKP